MRESERLYTSNGSAILHTDEKGPDVIAIIVTFTEGKSTGCLNEAMVIGDGIIKEVYVVDDFLDTYPGNNILTGSGWINKVDKCNILSTAMSVNLDAYGLLYQIIPLKDVTEVDILHIIYSEKQKNGNFVTIS